jgi:anaerobic ribonucleoside-triphosphate reductase activating protein
MTETLNIAQICPETRTLGPGKRFVIWVQGCPFTCRGCVSPGWIPIKSANIVAVTELAHQIIGREGLEGITISGGEPMLQSVGLAHLLSEVRAVRPELSAIAFTGFTLERLRAKGDAEPGVALLLDQLDVLIDGLYVEEANDERGLRGSSNQRVHFLTDRYVNLKDDFETGSRQVEWHLLTGELLMVGVPSPAMLSAFHAVAEKVKS